MSDETIMIIIASLAILLGILILGARYRSGRIKNETGNPSATAARIEIVVIAIVMIISGLIVLIKEF
jgi:heme/copper-type cytochrome/quinol oxidase subunit 2